MELAAENKNYSLLPYIERKKRLNERARILRALRKGKVRQEKLFKPKQTNLF